MEGLSLEWGTIWWPLQAIFMKMTTLMWGTYISSCTNINKTECPSKNFDTNPLSCLHHVFTPLNSYFIAWIRLDWQLKWWCTSKVPYNIIISFIVILSFYILMTVNSLLSTCLLLFSELIIKIKSIEIVQHSIITLIWEPWFYILMFILAL